MPGKLISVMLLGSTNAATITIQMRAIHSIISNVYSYNSNFSPKFSEIIVLLDPGTSKVSANSNAKLSEFFKSVWL